MKSGLMTGIDCHANIDQLSHPPHDVLPDGLIQIFEPNPFLAGKSYPADFEPVRVQSQIYLVQKQGTLSFTEKFWLRTRLAGIHQMNDKVSVFNLLIGAPNPFGFYKVR